MNWCLLVVTGTGWISTAWLALDNVGSRRSDTSEMGGIFPGKELNTSANTHEYIWYDVDVKLSIL